jgi:hypothetical protein
MDCAVIGPILKFSYVSKSGEDLLNGQFKKYDFGDVKIYSIENSGTKKLQDIEFVTEQGANSIGSVFFTTLNNRWFLELNGNVTDTFDLKFKSVDGRCCAEQTWIDELNLNGVKETSIGIYGSEVINIIERN